MFFSNLFKREENQHNIFSEPVNNIDTLHGIKLNFLSYIFLRFDKIWEEMIFFQFE